MHFSFFKKLAHLAGLMFWLSYARLGFLHNGNPRLLRMRKSERLVAASMHGEGHPALEMGMKRLSSGHDRGRGRM